MGPNNLTLDRLLKIEWLITNLIPLRSPARAEGDFFGVVLDVFQQIQAAIMVGEPRWELGILS